MQTHRFSFDLDADPEAVWEVFWGPRPRVVEHGGVRIEILHPGDDRGEGLIRTCEFRVPRYLGSGGKARSWEWLTELDRPRSWRYDAIGKPLWSEATGVTTLEDLGEGRTRVHFTETLPRVQPRHALPAGEASPRVHLPGQRHADEVRRGSGPGRAPASPDSMNEAGPDELSELLPGLLARQRACRSFLPDPVDDATIETVLAAACRAPSAENSQPWVFVVVSEPDHRRAIWELGERAWQHGGRQASWSLPRQLRDDVDRGLTGGYADAPVTVVVAADRTRCRSETVGSSIFPAVQNLLLAATAGRSRQRSDDHRHRLRRRTVGAPRSARRSPSRGRGAARLPGPQTRTEPARARRRSHASRALRLPVAGRGRSTEAFIG